VKAAGKKTEAVLIADRLIVGAGLLPASIRIASRPSAEANLEIDDGEAQSLSMAANNPADAIQPVALLPRGRRLFKNSAIYFTDPGHFPARKRGPGHRTPARAVLRK
jgi:hypothetical protein